ncbi:MAG: SRPBCC family protein [Polyangiaceae bacterium]
MKIDPKLDLVFERTVDVAPELVWKAWTEPEHLKPWFTPRPWTTTECEIDLRPGGLFRTVMRSPEGELHPNVGCYLEIVPFRKLVWTDSLEANFRPTKSEAHLGFRFTATILLEPSGSGTKYSAIVMHGDEAGRNKHDAMGFTDGWGKALEQLVRHVKGQPI